jgi:hypothetical protein
VRPSLGRQGVFRPSQPRRCSSVPRCQALRGSQMKTWAPESTVTCRYSESQGLTPGEEAA